MRHECDRDDQTAARDKIKQTIMIAFCNTMQATRLPPLEVLSMAAMALGMVYREAADAHRGYNPCPCGWAPDGSADIEILQAALAAMAQQPSLVDLRLVESAGRA